MKTGLVAIYLKEASANRVSLHLCFMVEISIQVFDSEEPGLHVPFQQSTFQAAPTALPTKISHKERPSWHILQRPWPGQVGIETESCELLNPAIVTICCNMTSSSNSWEILQ